MMIFLSGATKNSSSSTSVSSAVWTSKLATRADAAANTIVRCSGACGKTRRCAPKRCETRASLRLDARSLTQFGHWQQLLRQDTVPAFSRSRRGAPRCLFAGEHVAGDGDVFTAGFLGHGNRVWKRALFSNLGQFHKHRKIDTGEHFHFRAAHAGDREIGGRAAEHVGEDCHAVTTVYPIDGLYDVASAQIRVVFGSNRDGFDLFLRTHDMFKRRLEFVGKAPMGHKH